VLEHQTRSWGKTGRVWQGRIIQLIRTTLEARIAKERVKRVERTAGYDNDEDTFRREFGSDTELDELEAAGGLVDTGGGHGRHVPRREHGPNPGALVVAVQFQDRGEAKLHVEETDRENRENGFITTR